MLFPGENEIQDTYEGLL